MEADRSYFDRKYRELALIAGCLERPEMVARPRTVEAFIETKLRLAAALKAEHAIAAWAHTETCCRTAQPLRAGRFVFAYRYQRADLTVKGPLPYPFLDGFAGARLHQVTYACSGMAAISALLMAIACRGPTTLLFLPGSYKETLELAAAYIPGLRTVTVEAVGKRRRAGHRERRILWLDSSASGGSLELSARACAQDLDLIVCDTTCFPAQSGRIRRLVDCAGRARTPVMLVRSHTKLDSLGIEYGRLGSALSLAFADVPVIKLGGLREITRKMQELVRLLGSAALPAHFCPIVGSPGYSELSARRCAALLRNGRLLLRTLAPVVRPSDLRYYPHGMFAALAPPNAWGESEAAGEAQQLAASLAAKGFPVRHAGSFGFDFVATEAFFDTKTDRYVLRVASGDLPPALFAQVADGVGSWWTQRWRSRAA